MKSLWNDADRQGLVDRLRRLRPDVPPQWGRFSAPGMVAHLIEAKRMLLNDIHIPERRMPIRYFPVKQLLIYLLPMPKSAPTAPALLQRPAGDHFASDVSLLEQLIERSARSQPSELAPNHPAFGSMSHRDWGVLMHKHIDHHLRQFGC